MRCCAGLAVAALMALGPAQAQDDDGVAAFVEANLISIFYHEMAHALIDVLGLPIFGQEEDAADVFSILMIDALFEEDAAQAIAYDAALGFWAEAELREAEGADIPWWDVHGVDEQRFYNSVCIFYGADPDARADLAAELDLPEERADYCPEEYDMAADSWGWALDEISDGPGQLVPRFTGEDSFLAEVIRAEMEAFNASFGLPEDIDIFVEACGEANAFYDPNAQALIFCTEFESHLEDLLVNHL